MAKTVVTGAAGLLGRALAPALAAAGHEVIALTRADGDVTERATWARLPKVAHVFHLAGRSYVPGSWQDPAGFLHANVTGTAQALEYCRANGAHLVFASTSLFGMPQRLPIREDDVVEPNSPYALSKFLAEKTCAFYAASFHVPVTMARLVNIFGPGQRSEFLIPAILDQVRAGKAIQVKVLASRRDYIFIDDAVDALMRTMKEPAGYRVFNIGTGVSHSVEEVVGLIQQAAGTALPVVSEETPRPNEIPDVRADITRARDILGWTPCHTLADGIARLVPPI
jgi:GDP-4-dehydro-6-deoxy-D-mannose reductase